MRLAAFFFGHLRVSPVMGFVGGGISAHRSAGKVAPPRITRVGLAIIVSAQIAILVLLAICIVDEHVFNATVVLNVTGVGLFLPTPNSRVLNQFPERASTASAMQGFIQMTGGGVRVAAVSPIELPAPPLAIPLVMPRAAAMVAALIFSDFRVTSDTPKEDRR